MRILLLLRGAAGCGKTTWIEEKGLKPYALSADDIRLLCQSPVMQADGTERISQENDSTVWKILYQLLEIRMQKGEFTVVDATNSKTSEMKKYMELSAKYRYRIYCVDFTDIPIDEVKRRNAGREAFRRVPDRVIDVMYSRFATQKIPSGIRGIRPEELDTIWLKQFDMSSYKRIHHIGDIHGCYTALQTYLSDNGGIKEDEMYIFVGDYIDRGLENAEVVRFLISIMDRKNVLLLEGNHERWLWSWANDTASRSKEFESVTRPILEQSGIRKKEVRNLYRKFGQCAYYRYEDKVFLVTHAGLSTIPKNLSFTATEQMIKGAGNYDDFEKIADTFYRTTAENCYQIHGHRNTKQLPVLVNDRVFNLEGQVEYGGCLRCVQVDSDGIHVFETENTVYKLPVPEEQTAGNSSVADTITALRASKYIKETPVRYPAASKGASMPSSNISSFNFTDRAFFDRVWNTQTIRARGLYIDTVKGNVVARGYEKFFNVNERPETKFDELQRRLCFPVTAYVKENGFLGMVSYDEYQDDLFIACKSTIDSAYAGWFREMLYRELSSEKIEELKAFVREREVTLVFECVDMEHDPHIIAYPKSRLFLLDIVYNKMEFEKYEYDAMCQAAEQFGLAHKEKAFEILSWQEFFDWYYEILAEDYLYQGRKIEGFVIEDAAGFMTKLKLSYYNFWKMMRSIAQEVLKNGYSSRTSMLVTTTANEFYAWIRKQHDAGKAEELPRDICTLRSMFYQEKNDKGSQ